MKMVCPLCSGTRIIEQTHECADGTAVSWDERCPDCDEQGEVEPVESPVIAAFKQAWEGYSK